MFKKIIFFVGFISFSLNLNAQTAKSTSKGLMSETTPATVEAPPVKPADAATKPVEKPKSRFDKTDEEIAQEESSKVQRTQEEKPAEKTTETKEQATKEQATKEQATKEQTTTEEAKKEETTQETAKEEKDDKTEKRRRVIVMADAAPITTWVPLKFGGTAGYYFRNDLSLEVTYLKGKLDLEDVGFDGIGDVSENRLDFVMRYYTGKKFSIFAGYSMQETKIKVSSKLLDENPGVAALPYDYTQIDTVGVIAGITSRWHWDMGLTISMDWLSIFLPMSSDVENDLREELAAFTNTSDYKDIEDGYEKVEDLPRLTLFQLGVGYTF